MSPPLTAPPPATDPLARLNPAQREVALHTNGPLLVLAGAGTGKTMALTARIAYLIRSQQAKPWEILAVTFTNKAAREMRERICQALGDRSEAPKWMGTFHSLSARMLRRHAPLVGLKEDFNILDVDDSRSVVAEVSENMSFDRKRWPTRNITSILLRWKDQGLRPDDPKLDEDAHLVDGKCGQIYRAYCERLRQLNAADFTDLLSHMVDIFRDHPNVTAKYHQQFAQVLVDEYQDTNVTQFLWLKHITGEHNNICCVGDDDQAIYGWRGAEVRNILTFEQKYKGARVIRLEQNYRSTPHILRVGTALVSPNSGRHDKTLWTAEPSGLKVRVAAFADSRLEAQWIVDEIERLTGGSSSMRLPGNDIAILVRAGYLMQVLESRLQYAGIPYRVVGGTKFYDRAEVRDAVAYCQIVAFPSAQLAFERIVNRPKRGLGNAAVSTIREFGIKHQLPPTEAARTALKANAIKGRGAQGLQQLLDQIDEWRKRLAADTSPNELLNQILSESGYLAALETEYPDNAATRKENLSELAAVLSTVPDLREFLEQLVLVNEHEEDDGLSSQSVNLMTIHAAKGLEFSAVFLAGWEDEAFPNPRSLEEPGRDGLEEERRLAHVAVTRARRLLSISYAEQRESFGHVSARTPSRFISDLPEDSIELINNADYAAIELQPDTAAGSVLERRAAETDGYQSPGWRRLQNNRAHASSGVAAERPAGASTAFAVGSKVFHDKFGTGVVQRSDAKKVDVEFSTGTKTVMSNFLSAVSK